MGLNDPLLYLGNTKRCSRCRQYKNMATEYHKHGNGVRSECIACRVMLLRKYKDENDQFWKFYHSHTVRMDNCIEWSGAFDKNEVPKYSATWNGKRGISARRIVYKASIGELADDMCVVPVCQNKRCVRQSHMKKVSKEESLALAWNNAAHGNEHGWAKHPELRPFGSRNGQSKLSESDVSDIRKMHTRGNITQVELARKFGVKKSTVCSVINRKTWTHVE